MKILIKTNHVCMKLIEIALAICIIAMSSILVINVICRLCFDFSLSFAEEVGQNLLVLITFLGIPYCAAKGKHINMLAIFDLMSAKIKKIVACLINFVTAGTMLMLSYISFNYTVMIKATGRVTTSLQFPIYYVVAIVAVGFLLAGIQYTLILINNFRSKGIYMSLEESISRDE